MDLRTIGIGLFVAFVFGLCIFVHELGHFLVARWRRMHIVAFSLGFVKAWGWTRGGIEYRLGWLPFGGYVDLPQIDATGQPKAKDGSPLPPAPPLDRILTAAAGPACNVLFGFALGSFLWWHGIPQDTPMMSEIVVAELDPASPEARAGLRDGDRIVRINGKGFYGTWNDLVREIIFTVGDAELGVLRDGVPATVRYRPARNRERLQGEDVAYPFFLPRLPLVVRVRPGSPVAAGGLRDGDELLAVDGRRLARHEELEQVLAEAAGAPLAFQVRRGDRVLDLPGVVPAAVAESDQYLLGVVQEERLHATVERVDGSALALRPGDRIVAVDGCELDAVEDLEQLLAKAQAPLALAVERGGQALTCPVLPVAAGAGAPDAGTVQVAYRYGPPLRVASVMSGFPAAAAGLLPGDELVSVDGRPLLDYTTLPRVVQAGRGQAVTIVVRRDGQELTFAGLVPQARRQYDLGLDWVIYNHPTPWRQLEDTVAMSYKSVRGILAGFFGSSTLRPSHLSGPIGIVRAIGITVDRGGIIPALSLVVLITFSLAILNLLPFPVLDGGHIVLALYERVCGRPVPGKVVQPLFTLFVVLLVALMLYVSVFDVRRLMPKSVSREYQLRPAPAAEQVR